ncbi:hypothetical protein [Parvularcula marina]|uniref:Uncharacterized protein n=1 Tax=Parvularcula marina TaxID=2292771 RepID=A0A371RJ55_9PROT|nr:hypothetical protein [Parvularcula marina]RFB05475.1 hypothetical protein DX908_09515 [Parvularcula marina]
MGRTESIFLGILLLATVLAVVTVVIRTDTRSAELMGDSEIQAKLKVLDEINASISSAQDQLERLDQQVALMTDFVAKGDDPSQLRDITLMRRLDRLDDKFEIYRNEEIKRQEERERQDYLINVSFTLIGALLGYAISYAFRPR